MNLRVGRGIRFGLKVDGGCIFEMVMVYDFEAGIGQVVQL